MKRFILLLLSLPFLSLGQQPIWNDQTLQIDSSTNILSIEAIGSIGSDGIRFSDLFNFFTDDYLDYTEKSHFTSSLKDRNLYGEHNELTIASTEKNIDESRYFRLNYSYTLLSGMDFTKEAAMLALYGNSPTAGEIQNTGSFQFQNLSFSKLGYSFGIQLSEQKSFELGVSLVVGHQLQDIRLNNSSIYTEASGDYIEFYLDGEAYSSDPGNGGLLAINGFGSAVNVMYSQQINEKLGVQIDVRDLGFIAWNANSVVWQRNDTFRFDGLEIPNILELDSAFFTSSGDSLNDLYFGGKKKQSLRPLPAFVSLKFNYELNGSRMKRIVVLINHRFNRIQLPLVAAGIDFEFGSPTSIGRLHTKQRLRPYILYGGYNGFGMGVSYQLSLRNGLDLSVDLSNAQSIAVPNSSYGFGVRLALSYSF